MILETFPEISALTVDQKLRLVSELWQEVSSDNHLSPETENLLKERLAVYEANPDAVRSTDQVSEGIEKIRQRLHSRES